MRLALFGGTFDPVHHGHLILARDALEELALERLVFIPARLSPHKLDQHPAPPEVRCAMIAAAIVGEPRFELDDTEIRREGPSFTINTVEHWRAHFPDAEIFYLIGADNLRALHTWRRIDELRQLAQFVVFGRGEVASDYDFPVLRRRLDLSASELRGRVARGACIRYFLPEAVRAMITAHHLYEEPPQ